MKKLLILLILLNILGYLYLKSIINNSVKLEYKDLSTPILIQKKQIELNEINEFSFDDYFLIFSFNDYSYSYDFNDTQIQITLSSINNELVYTFPYSIIEPRVIEKEVIKEVYIEKEPVNIDDEPILYTQDDYLEVNNNYYSFEKETDLSQIIEVLSKSIKTNIQISIDYSNLNPNVEGTYDIYVLGKDRKIKIIIEIV